MIDFLLDPFRSGFGGRALVEVVLLGIACGPLGVWVALYRTSYAAESIVHGMLPGLVLAALAGIPLFVGAALGVGASAAAVALAGRDERIGADTGVAVAVGTLFGAGALLAATADVPPRMTELLFGDLLGVDDGDIVLAATLVAGLLLALVFGHRRLAAAAFDPAVAPSLGVRPQAAAATVLALIAVAAIATAPALGNLLAVALVLGPGAAALTLAWRLPVALPAAAAIAAAAGVVGLELSYHLEIAAGAAVAICAVAAFPLARLAALALGRY